MVGQRLAGVPMIAIPAGFSPEEYLAIEQDALIRHEYRQGLVYAMAGGSDSHNRLCINLLTAINLHLGEIGTANCFPRRLRSTMPMPFTTIRMSLLPVTPAIARIAMSNAFPSSL